MTLTIGPVLTLLLAVPALAAKDDPKDEPNTPQEQYQALLKENAKALKAWQAASNAAKTPEEERKIFDEMHPTRRLAPRFLALAEMNPKDPVAIDALLWVVTNDRFNSDKTDARRQALGILLRDHVQSEKVGAICESLGYAFDKASETAIRTILEKSPHSEVQGRACLALVHYLTRRLYLAEKVKQHPELVTKSLEELDKEYVQELYRQDATKVTAEVEAILNRVVEKYADVKLPDRGTMGERARAELFDIRHLAIGKIAPEVEGEDLEGTKFKLSDYKGKVVLLVFWGNWCGPCRAMYPYERSLVKKMEGRPFVLLGVNSDTDREALKETLKKEEITWRSFWNGGSKSGPIATKWNLRGWPTLYVIDAKGVIRYKCVGFLGEKIIDEEIDKLVPEAEQAGLGRRPEDPKP